MWNHFSSVSSRRVPLRPHSWWIFPRVTASGTTSTRPDSHRDHEHRSEVNIDSQPRRNKTGNINLQTNQTDPELCLWTDTCRWSSAGPVRPGARACPSHGLSEAPACPDAGYLLSEQHNALMSSSTMWQQQYERAVLYPIRIFFRREIWTIKNHIITNLLNNGGDMSGCARWLPTLQMTPTFLARASVQTNVIPRGAALEL